MERKESYIKNHKYVDITITLVYDARMLARRTAKQGAKDPENEHIENDN